jgi:plastocyanin
MEGMLVKIDMEKWKAVGAVPVLDPIWAEITQDGKIAWVTEGDGQKVKKIDLDKMEVITEVSTGPGPWGARLSCDETKLYVADKGESAGYGQQGRTMTIIDTRFNIVTNVLLIGRTTDHIILSPDCRYLIASSNADHGFWVYDAETEALVATVKVPNDGDVHGGTFVRWRDNGRGGVVGEVVSTLTGLRGSARKAQQELINALRQAITVQVIGYNASRRTPAATSPDTVSVRPGAPVILSFAYASGTSASAVTLESKALGLARFEIRPGGHRLVRFTAPSKLGRYEITIGGAPKTVPLAVVVEGSAAPPAPVAQAPAPGGLRGLQIVANGLKWGVKTLTLRAGEKVRFTIVNQDDEKHNLISPETGLLPPASPDVDGGRSATFEWTVPNKPGRFKFTCIYHPAMVIDVTIQ